jgi:hypothetical protein
MQHTIASVFMALPGLKRFEYGAFGTFTHPDELTWQCPDSASSISELNLYNAGLNTAELQQILDSCKALCTFSLVE